MIIGRVVDKREAMIRVRLFGPNQATKDVDAVIDTGFTSRLTLRSETITALGLPRKNVESFILGDGSVVDLATYWVDIDWDGTVSRVPVQSINDTPLVGMQLMEDYHLTMEIWDGGHVQITRRGETDIGSV